MTSLNTNKPVTFQVHNHSTADAYWLLKKDNQVLGEYALWSNTKITTKTINKTTINVSGDPINRQKVGLIGHCSAINREIWLQLLQHACQQLALQGCTLAIAPIDGNTWQRYRVVTEQGTEPSFFLESPYQDIDPQIFVDSGFQVIENYHSILGEKTTIPDRRSPKIRARLNALGITIRSLKIDNLAAELSQIYQVSLQSFKKNFLYQPISEHIFLQQYLSLEKYIKPELILIAEHQNQTVGFLFGLPNWTELENHNALKTVVFKTIAIVPQRQYAGLGHILVEEGQAIANQMGFQKIIYALIREGSACDNMTHNYGKIMRRYSLFAKAL